LTAAAARTGPGHRTVHRLAIVLPHHPGVGRVGTASARIEDTAAVVARRELHIGMPSPPAHQVPGASSGLPATDSPMAGAMCGRWPLSAVDLGVAPRSRVPNPPARFGQCAPAPSPAAAVENRSNSTGTGSPGCCFFSPATLDYPSAAGSSSTGPAPSLVGRPRRAFERLVLAVAVITRAAALLSLGLGPGALHVPRQRHVP